MFKLFSGHKKHIHEVAVIGLGRFGSAVALTLERQGIHVLGIDKDPRLVQQYADRLTQTVALDATDEAALREVGIDHFETVVAAIGTNFECNLISVVNCKALGVKNVFAKALTQTQHDILLKVGADRVVMPEREAGERAALELLGMHSLGRLAHDADYLLVEMEIPPGLVGRTLSQCALRNRYGLTVIAVERGDAIVTMPDANWQFAAHDRLVLVGRDAEIAALRQAEG